MRDVKAVYPTLSKAYFRVSDNESNCIFTCKAHQSSTLSKKIFRLRCQYKFYDCHSLLITYPTFSESATFCLECKQVLRIKSYAYNASSCLEYNHMPRMQADAWKLQGSPATSVVWGQNVFKCVLPIQKNI